MGAVDTMTVPDVTAPSLDVEDLMVDLSESEDDKTRPGRPVRRKLLSQVQTSGLTEEEARQKIAELKKQRAREYRKTYKDKRMALVTDKNSTIPECFSLKFI